MSEVATLEHDPADLGEEEVQTPDAGAEAEESHQAEGGAEAEGDEGEKAADPEPEKRPQPKWLKDRLDRATRLKGEAERKAEAETARATKAEAQAARLRALLEAEGREVPADDDAAPAGKEPITPEQLEKRAQAIASERAQAEAVARESKRVMDEGSKTYGDKWEPARKEMIENFGEELASRPDFFEALFGLENGHDVFFNLSQDPDETARLLTLSPTRLGLEVSRLAAKKPAGRTESSTPPPPRTLAGSARVATTTPADDDDMDEWIRKREEQLKGRRH